MGGYGPINSRIIKESEPDMTSYLTHMQNLGEGTAFARRVGYISYNFAPYLKKLSSSSRVLEIGPGTGELLHLLNKQGVKNIDIIDNDQSILDYCQEHYDLSRAILAKSLDMSKTLPKEKYDLIVLTQVFEHIPKSFYQNWVQSLYSVLNPGGSIIITVPNGANPLSGTERYGDLQHENIFTIFSFRELMTFADLPGASFKITGFYIPPYSLINIIRIILQKILHIIFVVLMIINGAIYQTLMTPNITLIITRQKSD